jgi:hypothetical protein
MCFALVNEDQYQKLNAGCTQDEIETTWKSVRWIAQLIQEIISIYCIMLAANYSQNNGFVDIYCSTSNHKLIYTANISGMFSLVKHYKYCCAR